MDYEKKYKEALGWMQSLYNGLHGATKEDAEHYFPELKESEDERIKQDILAFIRREGQHIDKYKWHKWIAWLENQGEQKQDDKVEPKFKVGDTMRTLEEANSGITDGMPVVVSIDDKYYRCNNELIAIKDQYDYEYPPMNRKQKPAEWSEEDENIKESIITGLEMLKDGASDKSLIALYNKKIEWLKSIKDRVHPQPRQEWSEEDDDNMKMIEDRLSEYFDYIREDSTLSKNQKKSLKEEITRYVNWLKSLKDRVQPQPKQEWSEEDKNVLDDIKVAVTSYWDADAENIILNWLKSIRPQNTWKPSEEQMEALYEETQKSNRIKDDRIVSLYNDLKKLMEE